MMIEKSAKTKEEAIALALEELGITEDEAVIEVIEEGSKGFLGLGGKDALVKVGKKNEANFSVAEEFLSKIFEYTGEDVSVESSFDGDVLKVNLSGPDMGIVIGKRGETLDALQHLTSLVVNKENKNFTKVSLDAENYREKRNDALESLAHKLASKVMRTRRSTTLEPMNAYERRIIHSALQSHPSVTTYSIGQGINRKVVIALKQDEK